jgi:TatD DNase family protein
MAYSDSHIHLVDYPDARLAQILATMRSEDVEFVVNVAVNLESSRASVALAERVDSVVAAVGIHPWFAEPLGPATRWRLEELVASGKAKALGEIGLDYSPPPALPVTEVPGGPRLADTKMPAVLPAPPSPEVQREVLTYELELAVKYDLPVWLHCRGGAHEDMLEMLRDPRFRKVRGIAHGFNGDLAMLEDWLVVGFSIGLGCADVLHEPMPEVEDIVRAVPLARMVVETDANPMISPTQGPLDIIPLVGRIAEMRGAAPAELAAATTGNLKRLLRI